MGPRFFDHVEHGCANSFAGAQIFFNRMIQRAKTFDFYILLSKPLKFREKTPLFWKSILNEQSFRTEVLFFRHKFLNSEAFRGRNFWGSILKCEVLKLYSFFI